MGKNARYALQDFVQQNFKLGTMFLFHMVSEIMLSCLSDLCSTLYRVQMVPRHTDAFQEDRSLPNLQ